MITMHSRESCWEHMIPANYATVRWQENRWLFIWILQWKQAVADAAWIRSSNNDQQPWTHQSQPQCRYGTMCHSQCSRQTLPPWYYEPECSHVPACWIDIPCWIDINCSCDIHRTTEPQQEQSDGIVCNMNACIHANAEIHDRRRYGFDITENHRFRTPSYTSMMTEPTPQEHSFREKHARQQQCEQWSHTMHA